MLGLGAAALATLIAVLFLAVRKPAAPPEAPAGAEEAAFARPSVGPPTLPLPNPPLELFPASEERDPASLRATQPSSARVNRRKPVVPGRGRPPRSEPNTTRDRRPNPF